MVFDGGKSGHLQVVRLGAKRSNSGKIDRSCVDVWRSYVKSRGQSSDLTEDSLDINSH